MPEFNLTHAAVLIVGIMGFLLGGFAYLTLAERWVAAWVQDRLGPNRVGPGGLFQPMADGGKFFLKEEIIPDHVDRVFYLMAPIVALGTAFLAIAVVPVGSTVPPPDPVAVTAAADAGAVRAFDEQQAAYRGAFSFVLAPGLDIGVLYVLALGSLAVYGVILAGWSANNKYSLLGALRSSAQIISYEIPLGLALLGAFLLAGSLNLEKITAWQAGNVWLFVLQPLACLVFLVSSYAETSRLPFDLPEAEQELVGGYHTEYSSSMKLAMLLMAEYFHLVIASFIMATVFFGGWHLLGLEYVFPDGSAGAAVLRLAIVVAKMGFFVGLAMVVRWTIPRFRFDQLMHLSWKVLMPLGLLNVLAVILVRQFDLPLWVLPAASAALFVGAGLLSVALSGSVTNPRRRVVSLPPGLPAGVTYAGR